MIINLSKLLDGTENVVEIDDVFDLRHLKIRGKKIKFHKPLALKGGIYKTDDGIFINLDISYEYTDVCDRCLEEFTNKQTSVLSGKIIEKAEDDSKEEITIYLDKGKINLEKAIKKVLVLDFPMKSLCNSDCKGLCPKCGINLNEEQCECDTTDVDPRLEKLKELLD
ncbi:MAG: DUF177 domain-containing protein [Firmicutes bacterium]|nr:DUF177 domain-containing protein [Bacillota bacterium]